MHLSQKHILILCSTLLCIVVMGYLGVQYSAQWQLIYRAVAGSSAPITEASLLRELQIAPGFQISIYADGLPGARMLLLTPAADLLVSQPRSNRVMLLPRDSNQDHRADGSSVLLEDLNRPHGLALSDGYLYIAETDAIGRIAFNTQKGTTEGVYQRIVENLPAGGNHWSRSIGFGPDGRLYLSIGSSCNVCLEEDERRATMMSFNPDGTDARIFATGLRNSVGFDWAPWDGALYATDNGRDWLGDDFPPCELNRIEPGGFYGWPFINGAGILDPDYGKGKEDLLAQAHSPVFDFAAHNAPLGIRFNRSTSLGPDYRQSAFVALHGSWNRSSPDGYKLVSLHWDEKGAITSRDLISGFHANGKILGRPVDLAQRTDGALLVSDDFAGVIYLIRPHTP